MRRKVLVVVIITAGCVTTAIIYKYLHRKTCCIGDILAAYQEHAKYEAITIEHPLHKTLFPPEMVPPTFRWSDSASASRSWLVQIRHSDVKSSLSFLVQRPFWTPQPEDWEHIKKKSLDQAVQVTLLGIGPGQPVKILSHAEMSFKTSRDPVEAPLFYREVPLPFIEANNNPSRVRWRFGSIASAPAPIVLRNLPVCGNCHSFSRDGKTLAMDVDFASRKGAYVITGVKKRIDLIPDDIITWTDEEDSEQTHGLLSQISPDGRYVISTVKDISIFIPRPSRAFSQLFFPIKGILCVFDRQTGQFRSLPGADDPRYVQSNPSWSPDGKTIVFARAQAPDLRNTKHQGYVWLTPSESKEFIETGEPFRFDLYRIPFNGGQGGTAEPVEGASHNGMSNYFARYSPDGRWIVFCRAKSYMLLQPDSKLYIIPAEGGAARRLRCNTSRMNSWHSWSPNGKWLVFASKAYSDYTQLCLTHIDENGCSTPPVLLAHMTAPNRAANIPEFVNASPSAIAEIHEQFLGK